MNTGLCQPANIILMVAVAGIIYQMIIGDYYSVFWWIMVGLVGSGTFQLLCYGGLSPLAWILMMIPVLIVCFFIAIALFASQLRIQNINKVQCTKDTQENRECSQEPVNPENCSFC
jgi:uncharacterized membrane protein